MKEGPDEPPTADEFLFGAGLRLQDYYIGRTPISEVICFRNEEGREFDLLISDDKLYAAAKMRLLELGVRIVDLS